MRRLMAVMAAALIASGAMGDDEKGRSDDGQRSASADCAHQANERKLQGKERRQFLKGCSKQSKGHDKNRGEADARVAPKTATPTAQPAPAAPPPAATVPAQPPAATAPTPAPQPAATASQPAVAAAAKRTAPNSPERRTECQNSDEYRKASVLRKSSVLNKCLSAP